MFSPDRLCLFIFHGSSLRHYYSSKKFNPLTDHNYLIKEFSTSLSTYLNGSKPNVINRSNSIEYPVELKQLEPFMESKIECDVNQDNTMHWVKKDPRPEMGKLELKQIEKSKYMIC